MSLVLQPFTSSGDLIRRALPSNPQQASQVLELELRVGIAELSRSEMGVERC